MCPVWVDSAAPSPVAAAAVHSSMALAAAAWGAALESQAAANRPPLRAPYPHSCRDPSRPSRERAAPFPYRAPCPGRARAPSLPIRPCLAGDPAKRSCSVATGWPASARASYRRCCSWPGATEVQCWPGDPACWRVLLTAEVLLRVPPSNSCTPHRSWPGSPHRPCPVPQIPDAYCDNPWSDGQCRHTRYTLLYS